MIIHMFHGFKMSLATAWGLLALMCFLILLNKDKYNEWFSRVFGFILKPMGKLVMYVYIFHYPMITIVYNIVGPDQHLLCFLIVTACALGVSVLYHKLYTTKIEPYFNKKPAVPAQK